MFYYACSRSDTVKGGSYFQTTDTWTQNCIFLRQRRREGRRDCFCCWRPTVACAVIYHRSFHIPSPSFITLFDGFMPSSRLYQTQKIRRDNLGDGRCCLFFAIWVNLGAVEGNFQHPNTPRFQAFVENNSVSEIFLFSSPRFWSCITLIRCPRQDGGVLLTLTAVWTVHGSRYSSLIIINHPSPPSGAPLTLPP